ncbi:hypothetical protein ASG90_16095 [Nocardioides sp. Soil797]|nr:hypothetical protein ASG90_16095 [Nocardioides sp. Soil797]
MVLLLAAGFRDSIESLHIELAERGHPNARPLHGFALQAIGPDGCTIAQLGQRLGVTKQAAGKTATTLESAGYVVRSSVANDRRAVLLRRTPQADDLLTASEAGFDKVIARWRKQVGAKRFDAMVETLGELAGDLPVGDLPGMLTQAQGRS